MNSMDTKEGHQEKSFLSVTRKINIAFLQAESICAIQQQGTIQHIFVR